MIATFGIKAYENNKRISDEWFAKGVDLYNSKNFREALQAFAKCDSIDSLSGDNSYAMMWKAACMFELGDTARAVQAGYSLNMKPVDRRLTVKSDSLSKLAFDLYFGGKLKQSIPLFEEALRLEKINLGKEHWFVSNTLSFLGPAYLGSGDIDNALSAYKWKTEIDNKLYGFNSYQRLTNLMKLSLCYAHKNNFGQAIKELSEGLELARRLDDSSSVSEYSFALAGCYVSLAQDAEENDAEIYWNKADEVLKSADFSNQQVVGLHAVIMEHLGWSVLVDALKLKMQGDFEEAYTLYAATKNKVEIEKKTDNGYYARLLIDMSECLTHLDRLEEAVDLAEKGRQTLVKINRDEDKYYISLLKTLARYNDILNRRLKVIEYLLEAKEVGALVHGNDSQSYLDILDLLAASYSKYEMDTEEVELRKESLYPAGVIYGKESKRYADLLLNIASSYYKQQYPDKAISYGLQAKKIYVKLKLEESAEGMILNDILASNYALLGQYDEAMDYTQINLELYKSNFGQNSAHYIEKERFIGTMYLFENDYRNAELHFNRAALLYEENEKVSGDEGLRLRILSNLLELLYTDINSERKADSIAMEISKATELKSRGDTIYYAMANEKVAYYHEINGRYLEALDIYNRILPLWQLTGRFSEYAYTLSGIGSLKAYLGDYQEAISFNKRSVEILERLKNPWPGFLARVYNNLGIAYTDVKDYENAITYIKKAADLGRESDVIYRPNQAVTICNMGVVYGIKKDLKKAKRCFNEALKIIREANNAASIETNILIHLANFYAIEKKNKKAIEYKDKSLSLAKSSLSYDNIKYADILRKACALEFFYDPEKLTSHAWEVSRKTTDYVRSMFASLTAYEREKFWQANQEWYEKDIHDYAVNYHCDSLTVVGYNGALLSKGLLLNSEIGFRTLVQESGDSLTLEMYRNLNICRKQIDVALKNNEPADSLIHIADKAEKELLSRSKLYGDYTHNLVIDWQQVRDKLLPGETAVEFVAYVNTPKPDGKKNKKNKGESKGEKDLNTRYIAYVLTKDMPCPKMVELCEESELQSVRPSEYYSTTNVGDMVWRPLHDYIKDSHRIYFAPSGMLYNIAIETVPSNEIVGKELYRMSSTRELAVSRNENHAPSAIVYGGLQYELRPSDLVNDKNTYVDADRSVEIVRQFDSRNYNLADSIVERGDRGVRKLPPYLSGSRVEAQDIARFLEEAGIRTTLFMDSVGTETSFKTLSGKKTKMMHIATHGFYAPEKTAARHKQSDNLIVDRISDVSIEDKAMTRSGLLMSGSNVALRGDSLPKGVDDGILTAKEIASLDLRGLDLVVLSACQTGLGQINGDGVFGLQRGFKKAGARSLMMSLWSVDDEATRMLMTIFYGSLLEGRSKYEALERAKDTVRNYTDEKGHKPYSSPRYWAAFILLDAL